jgi:hypothetical protein
MIKMIPSFVLSKSAPPAAAEAIIPTHSSKCAIMRDHAVRSGLYILIEMSLRLRRTVFSETLLQDEIIQRPLHL